MISVYIYIYIPYTWWYADNPYHRNLCWPHGNHWLRQCIMWSHLAEESDPFHSILRIRMDTYICLYNYIYRYSYVIMIYIYIYLIYIIYIHTCIFILRDHLAHIPPGIHLKPAGRCRAFSRRSRRVPTYGAQAINTMPNRGLSWFMNIMTWVYHGLWTLWLGFIMVYEHYDLGLSWFMNIMTWVYHGLWALWLGFIMVYEHYDLGLSWLMNIMTWVYHGLWTLWLGFIMVYEHYDLGLSWFMNIMTWVYHGLWTLWLGFIMVYEHYDLGLSWFMNIMTWVYHGLWTLWLGFIMVYEHYDLGLSWFMNIMTWVYHGLWTLWLGSIMVYEHYECFLGIPLFLGLQHYDFNHAALELTSLMGCRGHGSKSMDPHLLWLNTWNILKLLSVWVLDIPHIEYIEYIYLHM